MPFRDGAFDTVLSVQVLEHTPHGPAALVAEMSRVLAPGGLLILTAPFQFRLHEEPHDYFRYSPTGSASSAPTPGLEVFEILQQGSLWTVLGHKLNSYLAFRVARVGALAQGMGKLGHEAPQPRGRALVDAARRWAARRDDRGRRARARPVCSPTPRSRSVTRAGPAPGQRPLAFKLALSDALEASEASSPLAQLFGGGGRGACWVVRSACAASLESRRAERL